MSYTFCNCSKHVNIIKFMELERSDRANEWLVLREHW